MDACFQSGQKGSCQDITGPGPAWTVTCGLVPLGHLPQPFQGPPCPSMPSLQNWNPFHPIPSTKFLRTRGKQSSFSLFSTSLFTIFHPTSRTTTDIQPQLSSCLPSPTSWPRIQRWPLRRRWAISVCQHKSGQDLWRNRNRKVEA